MHWRRPWCSLIIIRVTSLQVSGRWLKELSPMATWGCGWRSFFCHTTVSARYNFADTFSTAVSQCFDRNFFLLRRPRGQWFLGFLTSNTPPCFALRYSLSPLCGRWRYISRPPPSRPHHLPHSFPLSSTLSPHLSACMLQAQTPFPPCVSIVLFRLSFLPLPNYN